MSFFLPSVYCCVLTILPAVSMMKYTHLGVLILTLCVCVFGYNRPLSIYRSLRKKTKKMVRIRIYRNLLAHFFP